MGYGGGDHLNGITRATATCSCTATWVKVHVCWRILLLPRLNAGPFCDDSATASGMHKSCVMIVNAFYLPRRTPLYFGLNITHMSIANILDFQKFDITTAQILL